MKKNDEEEMVPESYDRPIPKFLIMVYIILPVMGVYWFVNYWNGSSGFFDRGYWQSLQKAANTTYEPTNSIEEDNLEWNQK